MNEESTTGLKLCPNCANSIDANKDECPYCKTNLAAWIAPQWLNRNEASAESRGVPKNHKRFPIPPKYLWYVTVIGIVVFAFLAGGYIQRRQLAAISLSNSKQLQTKDQMIQSQQDQLAQVQKQLSESSNQLAELQTKFEENRKELSAKQQQLVAATRETKNSNATRSGTVRRTATRVPDTSQSYPQPAPVSRTAEPGVYETTKATSVFETPSSSARPISQIGRGTRINVVKAAGDWLEVRSKHGNPPGYVLAADARQIGRVN